VQPLLQCGLIVLCLQFSSLLLLLFPPRLRSTRKSDQGKPLITPAGCWCIRQCQLIAHDTSLKVSTLQLLLIGWESARCGHERLCCRGILLVGLTASELHYSWNSLATHVHDQPTDPWSRSAEPIAFGTFATSYYL